MPDNDNKRLVRTVTEKTDWGWIIVLVVLILSITYYNVYDLYLQSQGDKAKIKMLQEQLDAKE
jgi:hypothetical protein